MLSSNPIWQKLISLQQKFSSIDLTELFAKDPDRFEKLQRHTDGILLDFSKNLLDQETLDTLIQLAKSSQLSDKITAMFSGEHINFTENRAVLHTALRSPQSELLVDGENVMPQIHQVQQQMKNFVNAVHSGEWKGFTGKQITDIVNIGIGGSNLGPEMVTLALRNFWHDGIKLHFVSNVDGADLNDALSEVNPETSLFLIASKTFTTQETMLNATSARNWLVKNLGDEAAVKNHFVALSTNLVEVEKFGIDPKNAFAFWDFVGGRYSLWSAIGLSIALATSWATFEELLAGAHQMDQHFQNSELENNLPVILGLIGIWYNNFWDAQSQAILPYSKELSRFTAYLQQADMESNGKSFSIDNKTIKDYQTGAVVWGESGTNGQHAFYQLLHQGTKLIPADFIGFANHTDKLNSPLSSETLANHQQILLANLIAQTEALAFGTKEGELYQYTQGNRPTNTILFEELTPFTLGQLIALYEHKIFVQGVIWGVNSFDQWGVELGKKLAKRVQSELLSEDSIEHDSSTTGLIKFVRKISHKS